MFDGGPPELDVVGRFSKIRRRYPSAISFDRSRLYRDALADGITRAREAYQPTEVPEELRKLAGDNYFEDALKASEHLWTKTR